jgi:ribose transport system substrate-binding protein
MSAIVSRAASATARTRRWRAALGIVLTLGLLAACGDDDTTATDSGATEPTSGDTGAAGQGGGDGGDPVATARAALEQWYEGTDRPMPEEAPEPAARMNVWVISCGQVVDGCAVVSNAAVEAGEELGWDMTLFDGQINPALFSDGIRQAVAAGADGIILDAVDCAITRQALQEARDAGVRLLGVHALDCDDPAVGGEALWDGSLYYGEDWPDFRRRLLEFGATKADWIVANAGADAQIIAFRQDELFVIKYINDGFDQRIEEICPDCEIVTVDFVLADLGPPLTAKAQAALAQHPDATAVMIPYDSAVTLGIGEAIDSSGRQDELHVMGGEGFVTNMANARNGQWQDAGTGYGFEWEGWASIDAMNRLFADEEIVDCGCGFQVWDVRPEAHNLPPEGQAYQPVTADFKDHYRRIWGLAE